ncbi:MAG: right-handed parallel beta-helix repeat-containing protein [Akkermansiaceae bacterium]|nr:right-handed parallel beta-helix repeat-containing protein [Akkermansiaceae bacterium]
MLRAALFLAGLLCLLPMPGRAEGEVVNYESFGAKGDGVTDDLPAIVKAHAHANEKGLPVRSKPGAIYHLGTRALTAVICTDTDWGTSRFIIDDSKGVENSGKAIFEVRSKLPWIPLKIDKLRRGQESVPVKLERECLVYVENKDRRLFIRRGLNQNSGSPQKEVFLLDRDGRIEGAIEWDYERITTLNAMPLDDSTLHLRGGIFTHIANRADPAKEYGYWARNIVIRRSRTVVDGVTQKVTGEGATGLPYGGFLSANRCARVMFRNCVIDGRKVYIKPSGAAGKPVPMGTYGYSAGLVVDFRMIGCRMGNDIHDRSRWGIVATNFMKNILLEDCTLSRMDVHQGVSGNYVIRRSTIGHAGINAIGRGNLIVEDSTIHARNLVAFRGDYGSTWDGTVTIRRCRWLPPGAGDPVPVMFGMGNDGKHDFGYPCSMPSEILIDRLTVDDSKLKGGKGCLIFDRPLAGGGKDSPFPYRPTRRVEIRGLQTSSGLPPRLSNDEALNRMVEWVK